MLVNWEIEFCKIPPKGKQAANYYIDGKRYWFFKHFDKDVEVDVIDYTSYDWLTKIEKNKLHFHIIQAIKAIPKLRKYDCIISHGMPSAVVVGMWRRFFKTKCKHIIYDIGCFNSAARSGVTMKLMQFVSKSFDGIIYHTSVQQDYYKEFYPWLTDKTKFIKFGVNYTDINKIQKTKTDVNKYILCVDSGWRDRKTLLEAYKQLNIDIKLRFVGRVVEKDNSIPGVEQIGTVFYAELIHQIDGALFCVLPLEEKKFSYGQMTLLDQMSRGKCIVAAKVSSLIDYAIADENVVFYEPENVHDCVNQLCRVFENKSLRIKIGENAKSWAEEMCNEKIMALESESFIKRIIQQ